MSTILHSGGNLSLNILLQNLEMTFSKQLLDYFDAYLGFKVSSNVNRINTSLHAINLKAKASMYLSFQCIRLFSYCEHEDPQ